MLVFTAIALPLLIWAALAALLVIDGARGGPEPIMVAVAQHTPLCPRLRNRIGAGSFHSSLLPWGESRTGALSALPAPHPSTSDSERS